MFLAMSELFLNELGVAGHRTEDVKRRDSSHVHNGQRMGTAAKAARGEKLKFSTTFPRLDSSGTAGAAG